MKRFLVLSLVVAALALTSCNRFEETFGPAVQTFFTDYRDMVYAAIVIGDAGYLEEFYAADYLNNGVTRDEAMADFTALNGATGLLMELQATEEYNGGYRIKWELTWDDARGSVTVVDVLRRSGDGYVLVGNKTTESFTDFAVRFASAVSLFLAGESDTLDEWFAEGYYHDGQTTQEVIEWLASLDCSGCIFVSSLQEDEWSGDIELAIETDYGQVTFTTSARIDGDSYILCGNQQEAPDDSRQKVFVELFTATWCVNCPMAEEALQNLKQEFGDRMVYIEYHVGDEFYSDNTDLHNWYATGVAPTAVFQGQDVYIGATGAVENYYRDYILQLSMLEAHAQISDFSHTLGQPNPAGQVTITLDDTIPTDNLYLKWALVEESAPGNNGNFYHQIVTMRGQTPIGGVDLSQPVSFDFSGVGDVPTDALVYVWLQTLTDDYAPSTCKIYNVAEFDVE